MIANRGRLRAVCQGKAAGSRALLGGHLRAWHLIEHPGPRDDMDTHTLDLLEFAKIRTLLAARAACSLGKEAALGLQPVSDLAEIHDRQVLTTEMVEARRSGLSPPLGGLHDIRAHVRRAQVGAMLEPEELAVTAETLRALGYLDRWLTRIGEQFPRLGGLRQGVGEFSGVATAIEGCLDSRAKVLDTASRRLSLLRREIEQAEEKIQETLRRMLRSPEIKRILRYPNFTMVGHHYVLPVAKDHRGERQGPVQPGLPDVDPGHERRGTPRPPPGQASTARGDRSQGSRAASHRLSTPRGGDDGRRACSFRGANRRPSGRAVPDHGRHGSQHGGKDRRAQDRGPAGDHGPERPARAGSRRLAASGLRPGARRYRRRAEPRAIALDVFVACAADFPDPGPGDTTLAGRAR